VTVLIGWSRSGAVPDLGHQVRGFQMSVQSNRTAEHVESRMRKWITEVILGFGLDSTIGFLLGSSASCPPPPVALLYYITKSPPAL